MEGGVNAGRASWLFTPEIPACKWKEVLTASWLSTELDGDTGVAGL